MIDGRMIGRDHVLRLGRSIVSCACGDPCGDGSDLFSGERRAAQRHHRLRFAFHVLEDEAGSRIARDERGTALAALAEGFEGGEVEAGTLDCRLVAALALPLQGRPHIPEITGARLTGQQGRQTACHEQQRSHGFLRFYHLRGFDRRHYSWFQFDWAHVGYGDFPNCLVTIHEEHAGPTYECMLFPVELCLEVEGVLAESVSLVGRLSGVSTGFPSPTRNHISEARSSIESKS